MCNCSGNNNHSSAMNINNNNLLETRMNQPDTDMDYMMCLYTHPNRGQARVFGAVTKKFYGNRGGGDQFLVHRSDVEAQPHLFRPIVSSVRSVPVPRDRVKSPPPPPVFSEEYDDDGIDIPFDLQTIPGVTAAMERGLKQIGVDTPEKILEIGEAGLEEAKYVGTTRAKIIYEYIRERYG